MHSFTSEYTQLQLKPEEGCGSHSEKFRVVVCQGQLKERRAQKTCSKRDPGTECVSRSLTHHQERGSPETRTPQGSIFLLHNRSPENWKGFKNTFKHPLSYRECVSVEFCLWESGSSLTYEREGVSKPCLHAHPARLQANSKTG